MVVNGEAVTKRGEWPWMVALFHNINDGVGIKYNCGGTLISRYYVLTAAHCIEYGGRRLTADQLLLYLGKFNLNKWSEDGAQTSEVKNIYAHPEYKNSADADIAMLELTIRAEYSPYIQPACVWSSHNSALDPLVGKLGVVAGWGLDENNKLSSAVPKTVKMPIVSQEECLRSGQSYTVLTSTRTFCAGYRNGSAPCNGDSGGGFMIPMPDEEWGGTKWFVRGVVSTSLLGSGKVTCDANNFVIFTDIAKHGSWISQFTGV
ncbi:hypothetical protein J437_LFUL015799 [Ladona fulva]|uniref:Peptidase S1 domain-containing protein n=1 Tax=Ladona fulva TaxID=123851 RepID=A0A8K0P5C7_LADFU|nr:hypothetical protein J437_LFUL015799 [Ladona fulva]